MTKTYASPTAFHLMTSGEWAVCRSNGVIAPSSIEMVGFVHLSTLGQLQATAGRYYAGIPELLAVELRLEALGPGTELRWDVVPATGHQEFPHAYGPIATSAAAATWPVGRDGTLPDDLVRRRHALTDLEIPSRQGLGSEREILAGLLDFYRATTVRTLHGLSEEQARTPLTKSGLTLVGIVRHLALVETSWWEHDFLGGEMTTLWGCSDEQPDADFFDLDDASIPVAVEHYLRAIDLANRVSSGADWDDVAVLRPELNARWIVAHLLEETARHLGHADLIREAALGGRAVG